jgi:hypothetical protein
MKQIFEETTFVDPLVVRWYQPEHRGGTGLDGFSSRRVAGEVHDSYYAVTASVACYWDKKTGVFCADLSAICQGRMEPEPPAWLPVQPRILDTIPRYQDALRRAVDVADDWQAVVSAAIPAPDVRSDEDVRAAWLAEHPEGEQELAF